MKRMKRPKLPKKVFFIDGQGIKLEKENAWEKLVQTLEVRITVRGMPRQYHWDGEKPERVLFPEGSGVGDNDFHRLEEGLEEAVKEFLDLAFRYARTERYKREKRRAVFQESREFPETNRVMRPTRFKNGAGQSRLNFR